MALTVGSASLLGSTAGVATASAPEDGRTKDGYGPLVRHTGKAPTGYEVTFRYHAPSATRVQLKGEWYFERPSELPQRLTGPDYTVPTPGLLPAQWRPGDVPASHPNSTSPNFPVVDMAKGRDGVWTHTTPLPGGVFTYGFFIDADADDTTTTGQVPDPANPAWNVVDGVLHGRAVDRSQVYVPSDPRFDPVDLSWQGPTDGPRGKLRYVTYSSPGHVTPADENYLVIYTPPGYDPKRSKPYPTFYLSHGGGEDEMGWSTQGDMANILDNLVNGGEIEPMVVVMPNATGYAASTAEQLHRTDLIERVFPWVEAHYNVSASASDRAYSGLSAGGMRTSYLLLNNTEQFGYYGIMSAGLPPGTTFSDDLVTAMKKVSVYVGGGWQDPVNPGFSTIHRGPFRAVRDLTAAGVHVQTAFIDGGHEWHVWRLLLRDFLTRVAFLPASTAPADWGA
ncbi:alpha/beta hydrolase-fold protein [Streptomyces cylindrosporus]|uniref:Alpha/beta hydrolase-fold protein n=1 Tax=Streptomyces cylindrosporus TaxID=2927583 RepID=A0ABS9YNP8_9ACTN|nr:alpha/beta hydrolase-fold protein [Streptomyces cylindrosporus]MCI3278887.1 alpha/beta hydrolase-fold protein [Streptomyces cylindrosporus]